MADLIMTDEHADALKKIIEMQKKDREILEIIFGKAQNDPGFKTLLERQFEDWRLTLKEPKRTLIRTIPWSESTFGELGAVVPGIEIELDRDNQVTRVYRV